MEKKMIEIVINEVDNYSLMLLMSGFVISIFYNDELINPNQPILLKHIIDKESDEFIAWGCRCVSHDGGRLVLV